MRAALVHTWYPFFARFPRPLPVQLAAWSPLLAGRDCVVCSPTASGKTEAIVAPLVERHLSPSATGLPRLLVVSPTRALVNDLLRRLREPFVRLDLAVQRRTGDHARLDRQRPPQALITTPESLDSLLVRHLSYLREVRAIMLDELHILDGTTRGDQLRVLLTRLRAVLARRRRRLQCVVSSATIHDPQGLAERYLEHAQLVVVPGARELHYRVVPCAGPAELLQVLDKVWGSGSGRFRKILAFLPSRADVEHVTSLAHDHPRLGQRTFAHHGSLSRAERERVEQRYIDDPSAVCLATVTLELGIDIGDVDLVVLVGPPPSVASLLQRLGRGNRRTGRSQLLACVRDAGEAVRFHHLLELANRGDLCPEPYVFRPSVLVQQAGSLLLQSRSRWLSSEVLERRLPATLQPEYPQQRLDELLSELCRHHWLAPARQRRYTAGERLLEAYEHGAVHGNLQTEAATVEVIDESTGRSLGRVRRQAEKPSLAIGGRSRQVLRQQDDRVWVTEAPAGSGMAAFQPRGRQPIPAELARSLAKHAGVEPDRLPVVELPGGVAVLHFQGSLAGEVLARYLKKHHRWPVKRGAALALVLESLPETDLPPAVSAEELALEMVALAKRLARLAQAGPYHSYLPASWQDQLLRRLVSCEQIAAAWSRARFVSPRDSDHHEILAALAAVR